MKYAIWFYDKKYQAGEWAFISNFRTCNLPYEEEKHDSYAKIAITKNLNIAYQMREYASNKYPNYEWEVREKE